MTIFINFIYTFMYSFALTPSWSCYSIQNQSPPLILFTDTFRATLRTKHHANLSKPLHSSPTNGFANSKVQVQTFTASTTKQRWDHQRQRTLAIMITTTKRRILRSSSAIFTHLDCVQASQSSRRRRSMSCGKYLIVVGRLCRT